MKTLILTHSDCDGLCAGAIALSRFPEADVFFTKPVSFFDDLNATDAERVIICDIAITKKDLKDIVKLLEEKSRDSEIFYFDHHPVPEKIRKKLGKILEVYMNEDASSSELIYRYFQKEIPRERVWLAIYGAIGDYSQHTPFVEERMRNWDERALYFEACALVLGIKSRDFETYDSKRNVVKILASGKNPSDVPGLTKAAKEIVKEEFELYETLKKKAKRSGQVGFVKDLYHFGFRGPSALFAATVTNTRVGLSVHTRRDHLDITMRLRDYTIPLNLVAEKAAERVGGSGGGHPEAAGARIPLDKFDDFLREINNLLNTEFSVKR